MINRRNALKAFAASSAFGFPLMNSLRAFTGSTSDGLNKVKQLVSEKQIDENFWNVVRQQFLVRNGTYLNNGTYGPSPRLVLDTVIEHMTGVESVFDNKGVNVKSIKENIAGFFRCDSGEIAITRNTTDGMSMVAAGLDLKAGDEILSTDQEHPGGICCWRLKAKRHNLNIKQVKIPMPPKSKDEILNIINNNISGKTKVISISSITFSTGLVFPVKEISKLAHDKDIIVVVDGAHTPGMFDFNIKEMGCDFMATSSHKWLCAPQGTGILYLKDSMQDRLWTTIASSGWNNKKIRSARFDNFGTRNTSVIAGLGKAVEFQQTIGRNLIGSRIREMISYFKKNLNEIPGLTMKTSSSSDLSGGVASFEIKGKKSGDVYGLLANKKNIRVRNVPEFNSIRVSTHIYNSYDDINLCLELLKDIASGKIG